MANEEFFNVSKNIMFDPSLLMNNEKLKTALEFIEQNNEFRFYIPSAFVELLNNSDDDTFTEIKRFFQVENVYWDYIHKTIDENRNKITNFTVKMQYYDKYSEFYKILQGSTSNKILAEILFEEWVFLQEYSWLVSKSKNTFKKFKECGAWALEGSKNAFEFTVRRTLKKDKENVITTANRLRALGKWLGIGVTSAAVFITPLAAFGITAALGYIMLIDPDD